MHWTKHLRDDSSERLIGHCIHKLKIIVCDWLQCAAVKTREFSSPCWSWHPIKEIITKPMPFHCATFVLICDAKINVCAGLVFEMLNILFFDRVTSLSTPCCPNCSKPAVCAVFMLVCAVKMYLCIYFKIKRYDYFYLSHTQLHREYITSSEMYSLHLTHPKWTHTRSSGQPCYSPGSSWGFGAFLNDTSVVVLKEDTPPTNNPCQTWDSNPQPSAYKSDSLSIRPLFSFLRYNQNIFGSVELWRHSPPQFV